MGHGHLPQSSAVTKLGLAQTTAVAKTQKSRDFNTFLNA
jgi:hypothetical protein